MNKEKLQEILEKHRLWLEDDEEGKRANLRGADLQIANLKIANLKIANLKIANLKMANLDGAYLRLQGDLIDFSYWPLWCGSLDVKVDARIARQLAYHLYSLDCDDKENPRVEIEIRRV